MSQDGINRTHIDIVGLASLHGVLQKGFQYEDDILHAFDIRRIVDELVHRAFTLGEFYLTVLFPEFFVTHLDISTNHFLVHTLETLVGYRVERVVGETCCTGNGARLDEVI